MVDAVGAWDDAHSGPQTIARPRLESLIDEVASRRVTLLTAGAGFGKTTLLGAWSQRAPSVLHTLSAADQSPSTLIRALFDLLRARLPGLAYEPPAVLEAATDRAEGAPAHASILAEALRRSLRRPLVIMLDEWENIEASPGGSAVEALIRQAPPQIRIVVSGRTAPSFKLARMRGQGHVLDIGPSLLAFTAEETALLAMTRLDGIDDDLIGNVHDAVSGWPAGVRLSLEVMAAAPLEERRAILEKIRRPGGALVDYLTEEALDLEEEDDRSLLSAVAPLGPFTPDLCEALGFPNARKQLERLVRRGIYIEETDGRMTVMPLVAGYLTGQAEQSEIQHFAALASTHHAELASWPESLRCARLAGDADFCERLIEDHGHEILSSGHAQTVLDAAQLIPPSARSPATERLEAEGLFLLGRWDEADAIFDRLMAGDAEVEPGLAWRAGLIRQLRGDLAGAVSRYRRAGGQGTKADRALVHGWWAAAAWVAGDVDESRRLGESALSLARESGDDRALANAHTAAAMLAALEDDRRANDAHYLKALDHATAAHDVVQQIRIRVNRSSRHLEEGSYHEAIDEATIALRLAELTGFVAFQALGLLNRGRASFRLGRLDEAVADFEGARQLWNRLGSRQVAYALNRLGDVHRVRGELAQARLVYQEAESIAAASDDRQGLVPALAGLAQSMAIDDPDEALKVAERAVEAGPVLGHVGALLALGWVAHQRGEPDSAVGSAERAAEVARRRRDRAGLAEALELKGTALVSSRHLEESAALWREVGDPVGAARVELGLLEMRGGNAPEAENIALTLQRHGARAAATRAMQLAQEMVITGRPEVEIRTLGAFQVSVNGVLAGPAAWQSKKARDLVKLLIAKRGRPTHREALIENLWPDDDLKKTSNRLSVTLSTVRTVLDPAKEHDSDHYISADRDTVQLRLDRIRCDVEIFLEEARAALEEHRRSPSISSWAQLKTVEASYVGDFMEEDPYADWAVNLREEARQLYLSCVRAIAAHASHRLEYDEAIRYQLRLLERDPFDEGAHLGLVRAMTALGRHGEAFRLYRTYVARMEELGLEAAAFPQ